MPPLAAPPPSNGPLANLFPLPPARSSASPKNPFSRAPQLPPIRSPPLDIDFDSQMSTGFPFGGADTVDKTRTGSASKRGSMYANGADAGAGGASPTGVSFSTRRPRFSTLPGSQGGSGRSASRARQGLSDTPTNSALGHAGSEVDSPGGMAAGDVPPPVPPRPGRRSTANSVGASANGEQAQQLVPPNKLSADEAFGIPDMASAAPLGDGRDADGDVTMDSPAEEVAPPLPPRSGKGKATVLQPPVNAKMPEQANGTQAGPSRPTLADSTPGVSQAGSSATGSSRARRPLPPRPHPPTGVPAWDPDTKSHIPPSLTMDSRAQAYSALEAPPARLRSRVERRQNPKRQRAGMLRRPAVNGVGIQGKGKGRDEGITGEWVLDPALSRAANGYGSQRPGMAKRKTSRMERLTSRRKRGSLDELPTATFETDKGNLDLRLAVVNQALSEQNGPGAGLVGGLDSDFRRQVEQVANGVAGSGESGTVQTASAQVMSQRGHIRVELAEIDPDRAIHLDISSKHGMIFVLIPPSFRGPIQCSSPPSQPTVFLPALRERLNLLSADRGEVVGYLGTPPAQGATSIGPPRRMSERLRTRSTSTTIGDPFFEGPRTASPSGMDIEADAQAGYRFDPAASAPNGGSGSPAESTLFIASYSSSITIGLYSVEQTIPTRGVGLAGMLGGLMGGLEELRQGMNRAVDGVAKRAEVAGGPAGMTGGRRAGKGRAWF